MKYYVNCFAILQSATQKSKHDLLYLWAAAHNILFVASYILYLLKSQAGLFSKWRCEDFSIWLNVVWLTRANWGRQEGLRPGKRHRSFAGGKTTEVRGITGQENIFTEFTILFHRTQIFHRTQFFTEHRFFFNFFSQNTDIFTEHNSVSQNKQFLSLETEQWSRWKT